MKCSCGNEVTRPHGRLCETCRKEHQGHGKGRTGGRPLGVRDKRQRKPLAVVTGVSIPCLCCGRVFLSTHKGNRMCSRCANAQENIIDQGRESRQGAHGGGE